MYCLQLLSHDSGRVASRDRDFTTCKAKNICSLVLLGKVCQLCCIRWNKSFFAESQMFCFLGCKCHDPYFIALLYKLEEINYVKHLALSRARSKHSITSSLFYFPWCMVTIGPTRALLNVSEASWDKIKSLTLRCLCIKLRCMAFKTLEQPPRAAMPQASYTRDSCVHSEWLSEMWVGKTASTYT